MRLRVGDIVREKNMRKTGLYLGSLKRKLATILMASLITGSMSGMNVFGGQGENIKGESAKRWNVMTENAQSEEVVAYDSRGDGGWGFWDRLSDLPADGLLPA